MAPRIDPNLPLVWRSPNELQLGAAHARVVLTDPGELETGLIAALRHGAGMTALQAIGAGLGGSPETVSQLLETLAPAFETVARHPDASAVDPHSARPLVALDADDNIGEQLAANLARLGYETAVAAEAPVDGVALAVIAAPWVIAPARHLPWLRRDVMVVGLFFV